MTFTVLVHKADEEGESGYWAEVLELEVTTHAETLDELDASVREVISLAVETTDPDLLRSRSKAQHWLLEIPNEDLPAVLAACATTVIAS